MTEIVGFVGLGRMGFEMSRHLVLAGFRVRGVDTSAAARDRAADHGVEASGDLAGLAECPVVLSSLPDTPQVIEVYGGRAGLLAVLGPGSLCIDLSTVSVAESRQLAEGAASKSIDFLDAPVSGTSTHAAAGTLAVMAGGPRAAFERARRYVEPFSTAVHHCGPNGSGLALKLITNRLLTTHLVAIGEAILGMEQAGLDVDACLGVLRAGAVPRLLEYKAPALQGRDFTPFFTIDLMAKDLGLADDQSQAGPVTAAAASIVRRAQAGGLGDRDIAAVMAILDRARPGSAGGDAEKT